MTLEEQVAALADRWAQVKPNDSEWSQGEAFALRAAASELHSILRAQKAAIR